MSTRFYLSDSLIEQGLTPDLDAGWNYTSTMVRRRLTVAPGDSAASLRTIFPAVSVGANATAIMGQFVSDPLAAGVEFTTSHTLKGVGRGSEASTAANVNRQPLCVKVVSQDGTAVRATLLALAHYGPSTTEFTVDPTRTNRQFATGTALTANYTTQRGDRLMVEVGGQVDGTGSSDAQAFLFIGAAPGDTDFAENETDTGDTGRTWVELTTNLTFATVPGDDASGCLMTIVQALRGGDGLF